MGWDGMGRRGWGSRRNGGNINFILLRGGDDVEKTATDIIYIVVGVYVYAYADAGWLMVMRWTC